MHGPSAVHTHTSPAVLTFGRSPSCINSRLRRAAVLGGVPQICEIDQKFSPCHKEICIDGGHWVELACSDCANGVPTFGSISGCRDACVAHKTATGQ